MRARLFKRPSLNSSIDRHLSRPRRFKSKNLQRKNWSQPWDLLPKLLGSSLPERESLPLNTWRVWSKEELGNRSTNTSRSQPLSGIKTNTVHLNEDKFAGSYQTQRNTLQEFQTGILPGVSVYGSAPGKAAGSLLGSGWSLSIKLNTKRFSHWRDWSGILSKTNLQRILNQHFWRQRSENDSET